MPNRPTAPPAFAGKAQFPAQTTKPAPPAPTNQSASPAAEPPAASGVPPKPQMAQPTRNPRGPGGIAGQALAAAGAFKTNGKPDTKPNQTAKPAPPAQESKERVPAPNGNKANGKATPTASTHTPTPAAVEKSIPKAAEGTKPPVADKTSTNDTAVTANGSANAADAQDEGGEDAANPSFKKWSLYVKGLPIPVTEEEIKKSFGPSADKITHVKIRKEAFSQKNKVRSFSKACTVDQY